MNKKWYKSQTIRNAIYSFLISVSAVGWNAYQEKEFTEGDVGVILAAGVTLSKVIDGRRRVTEASISTPPIVEPSGPVAVPDFTNVGVTIDAPEILPEEPPVAHTDNVLESTDNKEGDIDVFALSGLDGKYYIQSIKETRIKVINKDSSELDSSQYGTLEANTKYFIESYKKETINSISVTFEQDREVSYFLYIPDILLCRPDGSTVDLSESTPEVVSTKKTPIVFPGFTSTFYLEDPIYPGSHFTWGEATKNGERVPTTSLVVENIIKVARELDKLRAHLGNKPIGVTSWYRDPITNRKVGGASKSSHLTGAAVDIFVYGMSIWDLQSKILDYWRAGGVGKGAKRGFVHVAADDWFRIWEY